MDIIARRTGPSVQELLAAGHIGRIDQFARDHRRLIATPRAFVEARG